MLRNCYILTALFGCYMAAATIVSRTTAREEVVLDVCVHKEQSSPTGSIVSFTTHLGELQHTSAPEKIVSSTTQTFKSSRKGGGFIHNRDVKHISTQQRGLLHLQHRGLLHSLHSGETHIDTAKGVASFTAQR